MQHALNAKTSGILFFKCLFFKKEDRQKQREQWRNRGGSNKTRNYINISEISHTVIPFNSQLYKYIIELYKYVKRPLMSPQGCIIHSIILPPNHFKSWGWSVKSWKYILNDLYWIFSGRTLQNKLVSLWILHMEESCNLYLL